MKQHGLNSNFNSGALSFNIHPPPSSSSRGNLALSSLLFNPFHLAVVVVHVYNLIPQPLSPSRISSFTSSPIHSFNTNNNNEFCLSSLSPAIHEECSWPGYIRKLVHSTELGWYFSTMMCVWSRQTNIGGGFGCTYGGKILIKSPLQPFPNVIAGESLDRMFVTLLYIAVVCRCCW